MTNIEVILPNVTYAARCASRAMIREKFILKVYEYSVHISVFMSIGVTSWPCNPLKCHILSSLVYSIIMELKHSFLLSGLASELNLASSCSYILTTLSGGHIVDFFAKGMICSHLIKGLFDCGLHDLKVSISCD